MNRKFLINCVQDGVIRVGLLLCVVDIAFLDVEKKDLISIIAVSSILGLLSNIHLVTRVFPLSKKQASIRYFVGCLFCTFGVFAIYILLSTLFPVLIVVKHEIDIADGLLCVFALGFYLAFSLIVFSTVLLICVVYSLRQRSNQIRL